MDRAYSTHGRDEKFIKKFGLKVSREETLTDVGIDWRMILEWILRK
jgi:hypothetical protein